MNPGRSALVTGASGQDGSYLVELLHAKGYRVHAQSRRDVCGAGENGVTWHVGDLADDVFVEALVRHLRPDEIYHLSGFSSPRASWDEPRAAVQQNGLASAQLYQAVRLHSPTSRLYQASSSEMFGDAVTSPQNEDTPFLPQTPYAVSKLLAHHLAGLYRDRFGLHFSCGILFNHESPRRPLGFVSQKICHAAACVALGIRNSTELDELGEPIVSDGVVRVGNLEVRRDFGHARDYVDAMWRMLQQPRAGDYVIGTGTAHSIRELCEVAFGHVGLDWRDHVEVDERLVRPVDSRHTVADSSKARRLLGWRPTLSFVDLVVSMVDARLACLAEAGGAASAPVDASQRKGKTPTS